MPLPLSVDDNPHVARMEIIPVMPGRKYSIVKVEIGVSPNTQ